MSTNQTNATGCGTSKDALPVAGDPDLDFAVQRFLEQSGLAQFKGTLRLSGASGSDAPSALNVQQSTPAASSTPISGLQGVLFLGSKPAGMLPSRVEETEPATDMSNKSQDDDVQLGGRLSNNGCRCSMLLPDNDTQLQLEPERPSRASYTAISIRNFTNDKPVPRYARPLSRQSSSSGAFPPPAVSRQSLDGRNKLPPRRTSQSLLGSNQADSCADRPSPRPSKYSSSGSVLQTRLGSLDPQPLGVTTL